MFQLGLVVIVCCLLSVAVGGVSEHFPRADSEPMTFASTVIHPNCAKLSAESTAPNLVGPYDIVVYLTIETRWVLFKTVCICLLSICEFDGTQDVI